MIQHRQNQYETQNLRSTLKMSNRSKSSILSRRRTLLITLVPLLLLNLQILQVQATSADYGETEELQLNSGTNSEVISNSSNNDEIYDPAQLQQAVEAIEERNSSSLEDIEVDTNSPLSSTQNVSTNHIFTEENSKETRQQINNMQELNNNNNNGASIDRSFDDLKRATTESSKPNIATTMISDYVRQGKAETFNQPTMASAASEEAASDNASMSDYMEDEELGSRELEHTKKVIVQQQKDKMLPMAMKFYQSAENEDENENNNLDDQPMSPPQQQLLPKQHLEQTFHNNSEEEYYEDSRDESLDQLAKQYTTTTTTTPASQTTSPITITGRFFNPIDVARAAIPGYPQSFGSAWTTTAPSSTTPAIHRLIEYIATTTLSSGGSIATITTTPAAPATAATTSRPAGNKQGKQINVSRRKLLPHEQLRNYIEDAYIRMPLAVIVDPSRESLEKTKALWRDALRTNLNIKIVLVSLNASGVPAAYSFNNTRQFLAGLNSIKENDGGNAFIGIIHASELVPYDSAVFISTAAIPQHIELVQDAAITLLKKRIRLYLIWYGERSISENETQEAVGGILGEVTIRSGGEVLHIVGSENSQELEGDTLTLVADAFRGSQEIDIPVDTTLSSLHVKIDSAMRAATLETPHGG